MTVFSPLEFEHDAVGWNDHCPIQCSSRVAQLEDLERRLAAKRLLAERCSALSGVVWCGAH